MTLSTLPRLTVRTQRVRAVKVPMRLPLQTANGAVAIAPLALIDLHTDEGVTGWLRAAALADAAGLPISSHLFPEISAHLLAASPTCHGLEHVDGGEAAVARHRVP